MLEHNSSQPLSTAFLNVHAHSCDFYNTVTIYTWEIINVHDSIRCNNSSKGHGDS